MALVINVRVVDDGRNDTSVASYEIIESNDGSSHALYGDVTPDNQNIVLDMLRLSTNPNWRIVIEDIMASGEIDSISELYDQLQNDDDDDDYDEAANQDSDDEVDAVLEPAVQEFVESLGLGSDANIDDVVNAVAGIFHDVMDESDDTEDDSYNGVAVNDSDDACFLSVNALRDALLGDRHILAGHMARFLYREDAVNTHGMTVTLVDDEYESDDDEFYVRTESGTVRRIMFDDMMPDPDYSGAVIRVYGLGDMN